MYIPAFINIAYINFNTMSFLGMVVKLYKHHFLKSAALKIFQDLDPPTTT